MINKEDIFKLTEDAIEENTSLFVTSVKVNAGNKIFVFIDGDNGVKIDDCVKINRYIESKLDREKEDFELNVSSHGLTNSLVMPRQFVKNIGKAVSVLMKDGIKYKGIIGSADDNGFNLKIEKKIKKEIEIEILTIKYIDTKEVKIDILI